MQTTIVINRPSPYLDTYFWWPLLMAPVSSHLWHQLHKYFFQPIIMKFISILLHSIEPNIRIWHGLHHNMCEGCWDIPCFCWFLNPLHWSKIVGGFHQFYKYSLLNTLWVHMNGAWHISCHVWEQENQVLLVHSCSHWGVVPAPDGTIYLVDINGTRYWGSI